VSGVSDGHLAASCSGDASGGELRGHAASAPLRPLHRCVHLFPGDIAWVSRQRLDHDQEEADHRGCKQRGSRRITAHGAAGEERATIEKGHLEISDVLDLVNRLCVRIRLHYGGAL
jgi:hypothetical protein